MSAIYFFSRAKHLHHTVSQVQHTSPIKLFDYYTTKLKTCTNNCRVLSDKIKWHETFIMRVIKGFAVFRTEQHHIIHGDIRYTEVR